MKEILASDLAVELETMSALKSGIAYCETVADYITRELLEDILESEEEHVDWIETQSETIARMELENDIQLQSKSASD